jgi:soluble lytic murein transglycosylase-like protein
MPGKMEVLPPITDQAAGDEEDQNEARLKPALLILNIEEGQDLILSSYRDPALQGEVLAFFENLSGSADVAKAILSNAAAFDIPPALAFSLCKEESAYNPRAINQNRNDTIDRGLFQLNSASFPQLAVEDFYNLNVNARYGLSYLRWCLDTAGTEVAALAMYNAGCNRVHSAGTPKATLDYISRILSRQRKIEDDFLVEYARIVCIAPPEIVEESEKTPFRLSLLTPLGR